MRVLITISAAVAMLVFGVAGHLLGQGQAIEQAERQAKLRAKAKPPGPTPRLADGKTDFSGIWNPDRKFMYDINDALAKGEVLPIQPWAAKLVRERLSKDDPESQCLPAGVPRQAPYPWRVVQTPTHMFFLFEGNIHSFRQIFLDGRPHPEDPDPTWYGHSVGKWESNDVLSIHTMGFNDKFWLDFAGHPHTEQLQITERFRRPDADHLAYDVTIDDPGAYTKPFVMHGESLYSFGNELMEYICNENNGYTEHIVGKDPRNKYATESDSKGK